LASKLKLVVLCITGMRHRYTRAMAQMTSISGLMAPGYLTKVANQPDSSRILCDLSNTSACSRPCANGPPPSIADVNLKHSLCGVYPREWESSRLTRSSLLTGQAPWSSWRARPRIGHAPLYVNPRGKHLPGVGAVMALALHCRAGCCHAPPHLWAGCRRAPRVRQIA